jgi:hypothetical protein
MKLKPKFIRDNQAELTNQLYDFILDHEEDRTSRQIADEFFFNDGNAAGEHTKEHGQGLSAKDIEYLLRQLDTVFEQNEVTSRWGFTETHMESWPKPIEK